MPYAKAQMQSKTKFGDLLCKKSHIYKLVEPLIKRPLQFSRFSCISIYYLV